MGKYGRLCKNSLLIFAGNIGSKLISLLLLPFYTAWLTTADYGRTDMITIYSSVICSVAACCIFDAIFIFPKGQSRRRQAEYFSSAAAFMLASVALCTAATAAIRHFASGSGMAGFFIGNAWLILTMVVATFVQQVVQQFVRALDKITLYSITGIVQTIGTAACSFVLIPRFGVSGYVWSYTAGCAAAIVCSLVFSGAYRYLNVGCVNASALREMLAYSLPLVPNGLMAMLIGAFCRPVLVSYAGWEAAGLFAVAYKIAGTSYMIYFIFHKAWLISAIEEYGSRSYEQFYNRILKLLTVVQTAYTLLLTVAAGRIVALATAPEYHGAAALIPLLSAGFMLCNMSGAVGSNFAVTRQSKYYFYSTLWACAVNIVLNMALIPRFGTGGACWSFVAAQAASLAIHIRYSRKTARITDPAFYVTAGLFIAGCMAVCRYAPPQYKPAGIAAMFICLAAANARRIAGAVAGMRSFAGRISKNEND